MSSNCYNIWLFIFNMLILLFLFELRYFLFTNLKAIYHNKNKSLTFYWLDSEERPGHGPLLIGKFNLQVPHVKLDKRFQVVLGSWSTLLVR